MKFKRLEIPDIILFEPDIIIDERGYFSEIFRHDIISEYLGYTLNFCQENETKSSFGVLRGLHFQKEPHSQTKLIRVTKGKVLDVVVDMRKNSPTFGNHVSIEISAENKKQIIIPKGFAHGFIVLSDEATFIYKVDKPYSKESESGVAYNDHDLNINWKLNDFQTKQH